jgi:hypothetical protein
VSANWGRTGTVRLYTICNLVSLHWPVASFVLAVAGRFSLEKMQKNQAMLRAEHARAALTWKTSSRRISKSSRLYERAFHHAGVPVGWWGIILGASAV